MAKGYEIIKAIAEEVKGRFRAGDPVQNIPLYAYILYIYANLINCNTAIDVNLDAFLNALKRNVNPEIENYGILYEHHIDNAARFLTEWTDITHRVYTKHAIQNLNGGFNYPILVFMKGKEEKSKVICINYQCEDSEAKCLWGNTNKYPHKVLISCRIIPCNLLPDNVTGITFKYKTPPLQNLEIEYIIMPDQEYRQTGFTDDQINHIAERIKNNFDPESGGQLNEQLNLLLPPEVIAQRVLKNHFENQFTVRQVPGIGIDSFYQSIACIKALYDSGTNIPDNEIITEGQEMRNAIELNTEFFDFYAAEVASGTKPEIFKEDENGTRPQIIEESVIYNYALNFNVKIGVYVVDDRNLVSVPSSPYNLGGDREYYIVLCRNRYMPIIPLQDPNL